MKNRIDDTDKTAPVTGPTAVEDTWESIDITGTLTVSQLLSSLQKELTDEEVQECVNSALEAMAKADPTVPRNCCPRNVMFGALAGAFAMKVRLKHCASGKSRLEWKKLQAKLTEDGGFESV